ncbi:MAG TPA: UbiA family prenyltransferase [Xanthobacteraceae bacterium]|nr:UbiA family prenyltransferase [Xanthobacteraceae bacterium]
MATPAISWATLLKLGRVSNLPTVWTNTLAGTLVAGGSWQDARIAIVLVATSLFYEGGMFLNDYFDREIDARERPERPIPSFEIAPGTVAAIGAGLIAVGLVLLAFLGLQVLGVGLLLAAFIVAYDRHHKGNPFAPVLMGMCRGLVYIIAAMAMAGTLSGPLLIAAVALLAYVAGISYAAWQERLDRPGNLWPLALLAVPLLAAASTLQQGPVPIAIYLCLAGAVGWAIYLLMTRPAGGVPRAVGLLIAAVSLVDAAFIAGVGATGPALVSVAGFFATLGLQRYISGT